MRYGSANGCHQSPTPRDRSVRVSKCCAKCRRGVPGYGELPCGYNLNCPNNCHQKETK